MAEEVLITLSLIVLVAAVLAVLSRAIRQPPIVAYILAGILVGPMYFNIIGPSSSDLIKTLAQMGVAFLLFIVGLSLDVRVLRELGKVSILAGACEITLVATGGFVIAILLGFSTMTAIYLAIALAFSSTVMIVKILSDKKELETLYGRIALGILIIEDLVAAIVLMVAPMIKEGAGYAFVAQEFVIAILLIGVIFSFSHVFLNKIFDYLAQSQEILFLFGIAWVLILANLFNIFGFSLEIGALIAGMSLASSRYNLEISGRVKPLRDFFVVLFFVFFGSQLTGLVSWELIRKALIFSGFIFFGKPLIVMSVLRIFGYRKKVNFLVGTSLAQISEFSLILAMVVFGMGYMTKETLSLVIIVALITIGLSSYSVYYSSAIYRKISKALRIFEEEDYLREERRKKYKVILFGYHRTGYKLLEVLKGSKMSFVVIDYNPKVIASLSSKGIETIYGDASDEEFLEEVNLKDAALVISTVPDT